MIKTTTQKTAKAAHDTDHTPDPIDIYVGQKLRQRRMLTGLSQSKLGEAVGLTFQQIQKYERGKNRMGASRIFRFAEILSVPVAYFFENITTVPASKAAGFAEQPQQHLADAPMPADSTDQLPDDLLHRRETLDLLRAYYKIHDTKQRRKIFELIKAITVAEGKD